MMIRSIITPCTIKDAGSFPPSRITIGLEVWNMDTNGQNKGLYRWFVTSKRTCDRTPRAAEKTTILENEVFCFMRSLKVGKKKQITRG
jgi:hypothetical protein